MKDEQTIVRWRIMRDQASILQRPVYAKINKRADGWEMSLRKTKECIQCAYPNGLIVGRDLVNGVWFDLALLP